MKSQIRLHEINEVNLKIIRNAIKKRSPSDVPSLSRLANVAVWHGLGEAYRQFNVKQPKT